MKFIFLQEGYDPHPDANSICTKALVDELKKQNHQVYIICDGIEGKESLFSQEPSILHVNTPQYIPFQKQNFLGKINTILKKIFLIFKWPIRFPKKVKEYVKTIETLLSTINDNEKIILISIYRTPEMVDAGFYIKKKYPTLSWIIYSLDGISAGVGISNNKWLRKMDLKWHYQRNAWADVIIQMQSHRDAYTKSVLSKYLSKTIFLDLPLMVKKKDDLLNVKNDNNDLTFVYGGVFHKQLREPYYLLEWFKELVKDKNITFLCYTQSAFVKEIEDVAKETRGYLKRLDYILPDEMDKVVANADCMINVGNASSTMVPSKLFVYMSACKPIIHFVTDMNDSCLPYLQNYPLALVIDQRESVKTSVAKTLTFLDNIKNVHLSFNDVAKAFPENTPKYTIETIISYINTCPSSKTKS